MDKNVDIRKKLSELHDELAELDSRRKNIINEIRQLQNIRTAQTFSCNLSEQDKISLFMSLFKGRTDVYPRRFESKKTGKSGYQPACASEWIPGTCRKPKVKCGNCSNRKLLPLNEDVVRTHLIGHDQRGKDFTIGIYPLLDDETCWFLAFDFDKKEWMADVAAFLATCCKLHIPAAVERSRFGNGAHVWIFFSEPVSAVKARQMGGYILTETMESRPELGFDSYDRFFPNQDTLPKGGFGNLIALPLQAVPRKSGNSTFLDEQFIPYENQWEYLFGIRRMSFSEVQEFSDKAIRNERVTGVAQIEENDEAPPWEQPLSGKRKEKPIKISLTSPLEIVIENQIYFKKAQLVPALKTRLLRLAAFQNPEFYKTQAMRMPVYNKPRIISCSEDFPEYIGLPRGCAADIANLLVELKVAYQVIDKRNSGTSQNFSFTGKLREEQQNAVTRTLQKFD